MNDERGRQTEKEIDMFIKIVVNGNSEEVTTEEIEDVFECRKYHIVRRVDGTFLRLDDGTTLHEISNCAVYVMNNEGKTIDKLR